MKRVSKRRKMFHYDDECRASCCPSIPGLDTDQRIKIELMDLMWRLGGALEEEKKGKEFESADVIGVKGEEPAGAGDS